jgi:hypothetical protein
LYSLFLNLLSPIFIFFTLAKVTFISWLFYIFLHLLFNYHCYCYHEWFTSILYFRFVFLLLLVLIFYHDSLFTLGDFVLTVFDLYPDFLTLLFQFPGCFVLVFYHDSLFTFFWGWFCTYCFLTLPWFSYFTFSIFWLFCFHCFCLFPWIFYFCFLNFRVVWQVLHLLFKNFIMTIYFYFKIFNVFCNNYCFFSFYYDFLTFRSKNFSGCFVITRVFRKVTLSSPPLWASFYSLSPLSVVPAFHIELQHLMLRFNAQGSRLIIVVVQLGAVKTYCSSCGGAQEKRKTGWNSSLPPKLMVFWVSSPLEC